MTKNSNCNVERISINIKEKKYTVTIGFKIIDNINYFLPLKKGERAILVTDKKIAPLHLNFLYKKLKKFGINIDKTVLPDGEKNKSLSNLNKLFSTLIRKLHYRDTTIISLGGGTIGDLCGLAASIYQRGVRFIQVPTTLLSQVDASIGGKTGINHTLGKNMIGSFYHPSSVIIDLYYLSTLPIREISSGLSEVIKYGIIFDRKFFSWIETNIQSLLKLKLDVLYHCIIYCCKIKSNIIEIDEYEKDKRMLLNFGHTFGHAIESYMGYKNWSHGEAISAGMMIASRISYNLKKISYEEFKRIENILLKSNLPIFTPKEMTIDDYLIGISRDKKNYNGNFCFILPVGLGKAKVFYNISHEIIEKSINDLK